MPEPLRIDSGELSSDEILAALQEGRRIVVRTEMMGGTYEVTLRHDGTIFYCDTPTTLHKHDDEEGMRTCIANMGYAKPDDDADADTADTGGTE
jgi:hemin uptake protein HemP